MKILSRIAQLAYIGMAVVASVNFSAAQADDTDIYINNTVQPESAPLVMFSIDYRPNLASTICSDATPANCPEAKYFQDNYPATYDLLIPTSGALTFFDVLRGSLHAVLNQITGVRIGLMMNHNSENNCAGPTDTKCSNGGYITHGFNELQSGDANGALAAFTSTLSSLPMPQGNVSHTWQGKELYFEFFRYLTGQGVYNGHLGYTDYGDTDKNTNLDVDFPDASWDTTIESGSRYVSPLETGDANSCAKIFAINFMFQVSNQEDDSDSAILDTQANGGMHGIVSKPSFTDTIAYLHDVDLADGNFGSVPEIAGAQNVTSYFIVDSSKINQTTNGYASAGGTTNALSMSDNPEELIDTLLDIFQEILSVSTTFVAASVPVNVFNRAESLDNVFIALFQADDDNKPFWTGNLKKLKLGTTTLTDGSKVVQLVDANGDPAIANDGRIKYDALTFWTDSASLPTADTSANEVEGRDGRVVDRGAAGQKIPGFIADDVGLINSAGEPAAAGPRRVFYDSGSSLLDLNADAATATALKSYFGATVTDAESLNYLKWLRGIDVNDEDGDGSSGDVRPWILGDPLHSRPLPINFGVSDGHDTANPLIYIAMASNDGYLHLFRNTDNGGNEIGREVWSFVPTDVMDTIPTLFSNSAGTGHPYTVDGAPAVYIADTNGDGSVQAASGEKVFLYFGMRRGGQTYYALDISYPNSPTLAWTITNSGDFSELGYTWSRPQIGKMNYDGLGAKPVVIFAGGYDPNKDTRGGAVGTGDSMGRAVYVVDAAEGTLVWKATYGTTTGSVSSSWYKHAQMVDSIPSDVTVVDTDGDQLTDRILVGDTGGKVWRIDTHGESSNWQATLLASVGRHYVSDSANDRRFFHRPDFVQAQNEDGSYFDAVILGSGNRPNPLDKEYTTNPMNYLYMIKDERILPVGASPTQPVTDRATDHDDLGDITDPTLTPDTTWGWRLKLDVGEGEKSLSSPLTLSNTVYFTTYLPKGTYADQVESATDPATCGPSEGSGLLYAVNLLTGKAANNYNTADDSSGESSASDRYKELSSAGIPADVVGITLDGQAYVLPPDLGPEKANARTRWRTFWYEVEDSEL